MADGERATSVYAEERIKVFCGCPLTKAQKALIEYEIRRAFEMGHKSGTKFMAKLNLTKAAGQDDQRPLGDKTIIRID